MIKYFLLKRHLKRCLFICAFRLPTSNRRVYLRLQDGFFVLQMPTKHPQGCASDAHKASARLCFRCPQSIRKVAFLMPIRHPQNCVSDAHFLYAASVSRQKPGAFVCSFSFPAETAASEHAWNIEVRN